MTVIGRSPRGRTRANSFDSTRFFDSTRINILISSRDVSQTVREQRVEFFFKYINSIDDHPRETHSKIDLIFPFESIKHRSTNLRIHISPYMRYTSTSSHKYPPTPFPQQSKQRSPLLRDPSTKGRKSLSF